MGAPASQTGLSQAEPVVSALTGFDPSREARLLGKRQREVILSLGGDWGPASSHRAAKSLWYRYYRLVDHKHQTDNCWCLTERGIAVRAVLEAGAAHV